MSKLDNCPKCGVSLWGDDIPEDIREHYSPPYKWRRDIGIEYPEKYDGVWEWESLDCGHRWLSEVGRLRGKGDE